MEVKMLTFHSIRTITHEYACKNLIVIPRTHSNKFLLFPSKLIEGKYERNERLIDIALKSLPRKFRHNLDFVYPIYDPKDILFSFKEKGDLTFVYIYNTKTNEVPSNNGVPILASLSHLNEENVPVNQRKYIEKINFALSL